MRKMRLELNALKVESFAASEVSSLRGTVRGHASLYWEDCYPSETCAGAGYPCGPTEQSCQGTCFEWSCHPGCATNQCGGGGGTTVSQIPATCEDQEAPTYAGC